MDSSQVLVQAGDGISGRVVSSGVCIAKIGAGGGVESGKVLLVRCSGPADPLVASLKTILNPDFLATILLADDRPMW